MPSLRRGQADTRQAYADLLSVIGKDQALNKVPILDKDGFPTGESYDPRFGSRSGQPSPVRLMEHLDFMSEQQNFTPVVGQPIPDFQLADPFRSETTGESISNTLKLASNESLVGLGYEAFTGDTIFDLEGFEPTRVESIAGGVLSFINPVDLGVMALGGGAASLAVKGLAKKALTKALIKKAGKSRGRQMYQKYVKALDTNTPIKVAFNEADRVILKSAQKAVSKELIQAIPTSAGALGAHGGVGDLFRGKIESGEWNVEDFYEGAVKSGVLGGLLGAVGGKAFQLTTELGSKVQKSIEISAEILTLGTASPYIFEDRAPTLDDYTDAAGFILGLRLSQGIPKMARTAYNVVSRKQSSRVALKEEATKHDKVLGEIRKDKSTSVKAKEGAVRDESVRHSTVIKKIQDRLNPLEAETKKVAAQLRLEVKRGEAEGKDFNDAIHEQILAASLSKAGDFPSDEALRTIRFTEKDPKDFQAQSLVDLLKAQVADRKKNKPKLPKGVSVLESSDGGRAVLHSFEIATKAGKKLVFRLKELTSIAALSKVFDVARETKQAIYLDPKLEANKDLFKLLKDTGIVGTKRFNGKYLKITIPKKMTRTEFRSQIEKNMPQLKTAEVDGIMAQAIARAESAGLKLDDWLQTRFFERAIIKGTGKLEKSAKASITFLDDGRAVIRAFKRADVSSLAHELGHIFRRDLSNSGRKEDIRIAEKFSGVGKNGVWNRAAEEKFARAFERYLADGKAPSAELKNVFKRFEEWLKKVYVNIKDSSIGAEVSPEMKKVFGRLLTVDKKFKEAKVDPGTVIDGKVFVLGEYAGVTVKEAVKTEADLAGKPDMIKLAESSGLDLDAYKAEELMLVTRSKEVAKSQGILDDFKLPKGSRVLAADGQGGFLVLTSPEVKLLMQTVEAKDKGVTFISPNVIENVVPKRAVEKLYEFKHIRDKVRYKDANKQTGMVSRMFDAIGGYSDVTAENSVLEFLSNFGNYERLKYNAAVKGHLSNQKEVGIFELRKGANDRLYNIEFNRKDTRPEMLVDIVSEITGNLKAHNLPYFTIAKIGDSYHILIAGFGVDAKNESNIRDLGERYGKAVTFDEGSLEFFGNEHSRTEARTVFNDFITGYNQRYPDEKHYRPITSIGEARRSDNRSIQAAVFKEVETAKRLLQEAPKGRKPTVETKGVITDPEQIKNLFQEISQFHGGDKRLPTDPKKLAIGKTARHFGGFHVGTLDAAKDRLRDFRHGVGASFGSTARRKELGRQGIFEIKLDMKNLFMPDGKILDERRQGDRNILRSIYSGESVRNKIIDEGFDAIPYINSVESPGSTSYLILNHKAIKSIKLVDDLGKPQTTLQKFQSEGAKTFYQAIEPGTKSADLLFGSAPLRELAREVWQKVPEGIRTTLKALQPEFAFRSRNQVKLKESHDAITLTEKAHQVRSELHTVLLDEIARFGLHLIKDKKRAEDLSTRIEGNVATEYNEFFNKLIDSLNRLLPKEKKIPKLSGYFTRVLKQDIRELFYGEIKEMRKRLKDVEVSAKGKKGEDATKAVAKALQGRDVKFRQAILHLMKSGQAKSLREALKLLDKDAEAGLFLNPWFTKKRKLDLPSEFYERDARIVIPAYIEAYSKYYAEVLVFGPKREKMLNLLKEIESKDPDEYRKMLKLMSMWSGLYDIEHSYRGKVKKGIDAFTALEVSTKIAMGFGTLLNTTQWVISFMPVVGVYESVKAGVRVFDANYRAGLRGIGVVDNFDIQAIRATVGYDIGSGFGASRISNFTTKWSGFQAINRLNLYWAASALDGVLPKWHRQAQGSGKKADIMKLRLQEDFGIDWKKSLESQEGKRRNAIFQFATKSQLQRSVFEEPVFFGETKLKPLLLFKRFGWRQANLIKDMIQKEVFQRGNYMPIVRLAAGGFLGGTAMIWAQDMIKTLLSGEEAYQKEDVWWNEWIERVASIGAFGMVSDMVAIDKLTDIGGVFSFAAKPVILSDIEGIGNAFTRVFKDYENYGDGWLALERNADQIFTFGSTLGSLPKALSKRLLTDPQIKNRTRFRKAQEKKEIFRFIVEGNGEIASKRIAQWNKAFPDFAFAMNEMTPSALLKFLLQQGEKRARAREVEGTPAFRQEKIKERRKAIKEFQEIQKRRAG